MKDEVHMQYILCGSHCHTAVTSGSVNGVKPCVDDIDSALRVDLLMIHFSCKWARMHHI